MGDPLFALEQIGPPAARHRPYLARRSARGKAELVPRHAVPAGGLGHTGGPHRDRAGGPARRRR